jgi:hypothetical protein
MRCQVQFFSEKWQTEQKQRKERHNNFLPQNAVSIGSCGIGWRWMVGW